MARSRDLIIIGGGVIGCGIAYELAKRGVKPLLLEGKTLGSGASHASAGMLAPLSDTFVENPLMELGLESFALYPEYIGEVEEDSGFGIDHLDTGILRVAFNDEDGRSLRDQAHIAPSLGLEVQWLDAGEALSLEPLLAPDVLGATYSPREQQVHASRLVEALRRAAGNRGAELREGTQVTGLVRDGDRVAGVRTESEEIAVDTVVVATGAWGTVAGQWLGFDIPTTPIRGQVVYVNPLAQPLRHIVMRHDAYAVPRADGTTLVGCTREHAGFAQHVTVGGVAKVLTGIQGLVPSLADATINHTRAGLRPGIADHIPALGPVPGADNVILAVGHDRSGVLLTPITAKKIATTVLEGPSKADLGPFAAERLARADA